MTKITDAAQRAQALDPATSFIVQAPAGSGKTELLTQRYLRLLANVEHPEEIAAITFTRKAAAEMRNRVLAALDSAQLAQPQEAHKRLTWDLAHEVVRRDESLNWRLRSNPNRLRIQTFDSLSTSLTKQMPMIAELGASPNVRENAEPLYLLAAQATLASLADDDLGEHLARVLRHLDNRLNTVERLIAAMLGRRDQWLPHILGAPSVEQLENALRDEIEHRLDLLNTSFPDEQLTQLIGLAGFAADNLSQTNGSNSPILLWQEQKFPPGSEWSDLKLWKGLAEILLTKTGTTRKSVTKAIGFPAPSEKGIDEESKQQRKNAKAELSALISDIAEQQELLILLADVARLPMSGYSQHQAELLLSLTKILLNAAAQLTLVFQESGEVDFAEIQLRALQALGDEESPTDLALSLDYRLKHLLVDEFQDTSSSQHQLLRRLTAGWQNNDGRSLFLVGDPMQSIYRFREAEVGLFLQTGESGLGDLALTPLVLDMNFRSQAGIIEWVNRQFSQLFPNESDAANSAVPYSASTPHHAAGIEPAVSVHPSAERDDVTEAEQMLGVIQQSLQSNPAGSIALLARGRRHLAGIADALNQAGITYQAIDVDPLLSRTVVQDLYSLTRALLHPADRLAWLALLRAPWLGLALEDLLRLSEQSDRSIYRRLNDEALVASLSPDGQTRINRLLSIINNELPARGRQSLRVWIESIWLALGGLAINDHRSANDAEAYFQLLDKQALQAGLLDFAELDKALQKLYAPPDTQASGQIQLMTMHASKGLEFDTVILPGLGKGTRSDESELLYWQQRPDSTGQMQLLMAPIKASREDKESISAFIRQLNKSKDQLETVRLLYVAATRARQQLHLFAHISFDSKGNAKAPVSGSLLQQLWPVLSDSFETLTAPPESSEQKQVYRFKTERRLAADWQLRLEQNTPGCTPVPHQQKPIDFDWAGDSARHVGTLVHRYLERIANDGLNNWDAERIDRLSSAIETGLANLGVDSDVMPDAVNKTLRALRQTLEHDEGRWILDNSHRQASCELPLTVHDEDSHHYIIDRTFIDDQGTRWVIDYKTGDHQDDDIELFLDHEQERYRDQLETYGRILKLMEERPIKLALYFPLLKNWRTWDYLK